MHSFMDACHTMQACIEIDENFGSNPSEYSLSQSSNHALLIILDPYPLNCPFLPYCLAFFVLKLIAHRSKKFVAELQCNAAE
jgi:hypothetical protein